MNLAVAASHEISSPSAALHLYRRLAALPPGSVVFLRAPVGAQEPQGLLERLVRHWAPELNLKTILVSPGAAGGREGTFERDYEMVEGADMLLAYFSVDRRMEGGTGHVVNAALNRDLPTEAFVIDEDGHLQRLGDWP